MNKVVTAIAGALIVALSLAPVHGGQAQGQAPRPSKWWLDPVCRMRVGLSDAQTADLDKVFLSVRDELRAEKAELEKREAALSRLLGESNEDEAVVVRTIDRVEAARSALSKTRTLMLYRMHRLLTPEQRRKLEAYEQSRAAGTAPHPSTQQR
ncbi:MAG: periplasmic heavy metal sensor [Acidobacteria bacterium]|nr:periplasmic heavy metal sensor [Acidobacteriota bacterium]